MRAASAILVLREQLFVADDAAATLANLQQPTGLAHGALAMLLTLVLSQALAAVAFYRLYRHASPFAAVGVMRRATSASS